MNNLLKHKYSFAQPMSWLMFFAIGLMSCQSLQADLVVDVGDVELLEDTAGQIVSFLATGPDEVQGLNFNIQVADGGPIAGGSVSAVITAIDIVGPGTVFETNNTGQQGGVIVPQIAGVSTTTISGRVPAEGVLAFVTFDTTGLFAASFDPVPLLLAGTLNGDTDFAGSIDSAGNTVEFTVNNGTLSLTSAIPEPGSFVIFGVLGLAAGLRRTRRSV